MGRGAVVLLPGVLKGGGLQANCEVLARKFQLPSGGSPLPLATYCDGSPIGAPEDVPDGTYIVHFDGHQCELTRQKGSWMLCGTVTKSQKPSSVPRTQIAAPQA